MASKQLSLSEQAFNVLKLYLEDDHKPHQKAAHAAFRASVDADDTSDKVNMGQLGPEHHVTARDLHKAAHDKHLAAAQSMMAAGQSSTAGDHQHIAMQHAKHMMLHHKQHMAQPFGASAPPKKAAGEAIEPMPQAGSMAEQRRLMGFTNYPTFAESCTLKEVDDFSAQIRDWNWQQRNLMGLGNNYPTLNEARGQDRGQLMNEHQQALMGRGAPYPSLMESRGEVDEVVRIDPKNFANKGQVVPSRSDVAAQMKKARQGAFGGHGGGASGATDKPVASPAGSTNDQRRHTFAVQSKLAGAKRVASRHVGEEEEVEMYAETADEVAGMLDRLDELSSKADVPKMVKKQAHAIEKKPGAIKRKPGGANSRAGVAYATAWKHFCKENPGSRHCSGKSGAVGKVGEDAASDKVLAKLAQKHGAVDVPDANRMAGKSTLNRLKNKFGEQRQRQREDAVSDRALDRLGAKHGPTGAPKSAAQTTLDKLKRKYKGEDATGDKVLAKLAMKHGPTGEPKSPAQYTLDKLKRMRKGEGVGLGVDIQREDSATDAESELKATKRALMMKKLRKSA